MNEHVRRFVFVPGREINYSGEFKIAVLKASIQFYSIMTKEMENNPTSSFVKTNDKKTVKITN
jgi:hypothetical protein